jgi:kynurenine formamidase
MPGIDPSLHRLQHRLPVLLTLVAMTMSSACAPGAEVPAPSPVDEAEPGFDLLDPELELIDLSYPLSPDSLYWPTGAPFEHEVSAGVSEGGYWYASGSFASPEHLGTHLDAPIHFGEGRWTSAEIPLQRLFAPGVVIDISARAGTDPDATLTPQDITAWEERNGPLPGDTIVIVRTGWASRWPDWNAYYGSETPQDVGTLHFPGVSAAAAEALVERGVAGVGIDTASIDPGTSADFQAHQVLAAANIFNLENLTGVEALPETGFAIIALPMKIDNGTGGPTRVVAVIPG